MDLKEYLNKRGFRLIEEKDKLKVYMDDYAFFIQDQMLILPIPLPTGSESLDDLIAMGTKYARASRIIQGLGGPVEYRISGSTVEVIKRFDSKKDLEEKLIKALEGIESLRYFL